MWCYCPVCNNFFWCEHGGTPICSSKKCIERRYQEIIKGIEERRDFLAGELQSYSEDVINRNCVLYVRPDCTVLLSLVDDQESDCQIFGDKVTGVVFDIS